MSQRSGEQLKLRGLEKAASHHEADLRRAQQIAEFIAGFQSAITADDVREAFKIHQGRELRIGNCMGNLFKNRKKWVCVGSVKSKRPSSHGRFIPQWQLRQAYKPAPHAPEVGIENGVRFCITCGKEMEACSCESKSD